MGTLEIWKDIPWYEWIYQASNLWRIKSLNFHRSKSERIMKLWKHPDWYLTIRLRYTIKKLYLVHRLVAIVFLDNINSKPEVNHKNWIKADNMVENLEWCTREENMTHANNILWRWAKWKFWKYSNSSKKVVQIYNDEIINIWWSIIDAEKSLWLSHWNISRCCKWKRKTTWWYSWKYQNSLSHIWNNPETPRTQDN